MPTAELYDGICIMGCGGKAYLAVDSCMVVYGGSAERYVRSALISNTI